MPPKVPHSLAWAYSVWSQHQLTYGRDPMILNLWFSQFPGKFLAHHRPVGFHLAKWSECFLEFWIYWQGEGVTVRV